VIYLGFERLGKRMAEWRHKRLGMNPDPEVQGAAINMPDMPPPLKGRRK
jgi:hypothetical protein